MIDIPYLNEQQRVANKKIENLKNLPNGQMFWSIAGWGGEVHSNPQTTNPDVYGSTYINVVPEYTHVSASTGIEAVGFFSDINPLDGNHTNLLCGRLEIRKKGNYFFTIVKDNSTGLSSFYYLKDDTATLSSIRGLWIKLNPRMVNQTTKKYLDEDYLFKGDKFDWLQYKDLLIICSGKEDYFDNQGIRSGLMILDLQSFVWSSADCGKAAKVDLSDNNRIESIIVDPNKYEDSLSPFNPSIIEEYQDFIHISGNSINPYQVKVSEKQNPRNFVFGVLDASITSLTPEDNRRASSYLLPKPIVSLTKFADAIYVGTKDLFYRYALNPSPNNPVDIESITPDSMSNSGTVSNRAVKVFNGNLFFASDYQVIPELTTRALEYKTSAFGNSYSIATPPQKLTYTQDELLKKCNIKNSTIGIYKDSIYWSVAFCKEAEEDPTNNLTIVYKKIGDYTMFSRVDYIKANYFQEVGNRGLLYSSATDGNVYIMREDINYIDNHSIDNINRTYDNYTPNPLIPQRIIQTGLIGVAKGDTFFSKKKLTHLFIEGGFSNNSTAIIEVYGIGSACGDSNCATSPFYRKELNIQYDNITDNLPCDDPNGCKDCNPLANLGEYRNVRYFKKFIKLETLDTPPLYNELYVRFILDNTSNFFLSRISGLYTQEDPLDESLLLCTELLGEGEAIIMGKGTGDEYQSTSCEICRA